MPKYYIYLHKRLDNNEIFYVGRGKFYTNEFSLKYKTSKIPYRRAYSKDNRNKKWHIIVKEIKYIVIILFDNLEFKEACNLETQLIHFHGRLDLGTGTLSNMTDGGEEDINRVYKLPIKVRSYNNDGDLLQIFNSMKEASSHYKLNINTITHQCKNRKTFSRKGVRFRYDSEKLDSINVSYPFVYKESNKKVNQYDLNMNLIKSYNSIGEASIKTNLNHTRIWKCCNHTENRMRYKGYIWQYKES